METSPKTSHTAIIDATAALQRDESREALGQSAQDRCVDRF